VKTISRQVTASHAGGPAEKQENDEASQPDQTPRGPDLFWDPDWKKSILLNFFRSFLENL